MTGRKYSAIAWIIKSFNALKSVCVCGVLFLFVGFVGGGFLVVEEEYWGSRNEKEQQQQQW